MKKNKIGIMTFHAPKNCGSRLQAFALQKTLRDRLGKDREIINFSNEKQSYMYSRYVRIHSIKSFAKNVQGFLFGRLLKRHSEDFEKFSTKYLHISEEFYGDDESLKAIDGDYPILICGSDQVWNIECFDADDAYYLDFAKKSKKIAYATSLGGTNLVKKGEATIEKYRKLTEDFVAISVREHNAQKWMKIITGKDVMLTLDPTLLLTKEDYDIIAAPRICEGEYIFWYSFHYMDEVNEIVKNISKKYNLPVYVIDANMWSKKALFRYGFHITEHGGPEVFISAIKYAQLVLTTSFHGTVFSTIYEKPFWYVKTKLSNEDDDRATSLMSQLGVLDRYKTVSEIYESDIIGRIDYTTSREYVAKLKEKSINYLIESVDRAYREVEAIG